MFDKDLGVYVSVKTDLFVTIRSSDKLNATLTNLPDSNSIKQID